MCHTPPGIIIRSALQNVGASTSHNHKGLHGLLQGYLYLYHIYGRAAVQAVSRCLPTAAAWVHFREQDVGFMVDKTALGQDFIRVIRFILPITIPPMSPSS
jgi:hypothetical protein